MINTSGPQRIYVVSVSSFRMADDPLGTMGQRFARQEGPAGEVKLSVYKSISSDGASFSRMETLYR
jgi:hypothetical protein